MIMFIYVYMECDAGEDVYVNDYTIGYNNTITLLFHATDTCPCLHEDPLFWWM
jgi:hypothetical protein